MTEPGCTETYTIVSPMPDACLGVIDTDRPHQTDTPHVVPAGHVQLESALVAAQLGRSVVFFENAYKFGLVSRVDVQLITKHVEYVPDARRHLAPPGPIEVRTKIAIVEEEGVRPAVTLVPWIFVPMAASQLLRGGPFVFWGWELPWRFEIEMNAGLLFSTRPTEIALATALTWTVAGTFRVFADVYDAGTDVTLARARCGRSRATCRSTPGLTSASTARRRRSSASRGGANLAVVKRAVVVALVVASVVGCNRKKKVDPTIAQATGESSVLPRVTRAASGKTRAESTTIGGRPVVVVSPVVVDPEKKKPLVFVFHGDGGDAEEMHRDWPWEKVLGDVAYFAYAQARLPRSWDLETPRDNVDVAYIVSVIDALASKNPIDRSRVFMTGYSNGGFFANTFACQRSDLVRAISSSAGGAPYNQAEKWPNGFPKCPGEKPVAAIALHGRRDFGVTLDSGRFSAEYWASVNGCNVAEMETTAYDECKAYRGCPAGKNVVWCEIPDLGHWVWDRAVETSWTFFERQ